MKLIAVFYCHMIVLAQQLLYNIWILVCVEANGDLKALKYMSASSAI